MISDLENYPLVKEIFDENENAEKIFTDFCNIYERNHHSTLDFLEHILKQKKAGIVRIETRHRAFHPELQDILSTYTNYEVSVFRDCFLGDLTKFGTFVKESEGDYHFWE